MIDSCNFIKHDIEKLNTKRLISLGIVYHKLQYRKGKYGKNYVKYGNVEDEIEDYLISTGIGFEYKDIHFMYLAKFKCVIIIANTHKVLQKSDICLSDRDTYIDKVNKIIKQVLDIDFSQLLLYRIDYYVDLDLDYKIMYEYLHLLDKHKSTYKNIKRINEYETSIYLTSKGGTNRINIYDKYKCEKDKYNKKYEKEYKKTSISLAEYKQKHFPCYEYYKNIFRIEVQNTKNLINSKSKKLKSIESISKELFNDDINSMIHYKIEKNLYGYWNKQSMYIYFFNFLKEFLYTGTYYKSKIANKMIKNSNYSNCEKAHLKEFITLVNKYGITNVTKPNNQKPVNHRQWNEEKVCEYMEKLLSMHIIFLRIDRDYIKSVDKITKIELEKKFKEYLQVVDNSNYSINDKQELKEFLIVINQFGFGNVTDKNTNKIIEHSKWCGATVKNYIKNLATLGIDITELNKAHNKKKLKIANNKINKSKHTKSWKNKLKRFAKVVNDYGIDDTIASNNKEIAEKSKNSKHQKYSSSTVKKYINMLEKIGINPVTIDNNSEIDSLESLFPLILKTTNKKYFDVDNLEIPVPKKIKLNQSRITKRILFKEKF